MSTEYPPNVCQIPNECPLNVFQMSVEYLTTMSDTSYVKRISTECLSNIRQMSIENLPNICTTMSDTSYVNRIFAECLSNI